MTINRVNEIVENLRSASSKSNNHISAALLPEALDTLVSLIGSLQRRIDNLESQLTLVRSDLQSASKTVAAPTEEPVPTKTKPRAKKILTETSEETKSVEK